MTLSVTALVLLAALMHALWNALIKSSRDTGLETALVAAAAAFVSALLLPWMPLPASASWPWLIASVILHFGYFSLLAAVYRHGDLSFAYPLMRGLPPLLVACAGSLLLHDPASPGLWAGIIAISLGVLWIGGIRKRVAPAQRRSTRLALANAGLIAAYTVVDGIGVRQSGNAASYGLWLFFLIGVPYAGALVWQRRLTVLAHVRQWWWRTLLGGALSVAAYLIALWAMTQAPIAAVAALRETSIIFAAAIGSLLLKEPFGRDRIAGACMMAAGIALLRL